MSAVDDVLGRVPLGQLAEQLGTDEATAGAAAREAIASLLGGVADNANDSQRAAGLAGALDQHSRSPFAAQDSVDLGAVDTDDGNKIVSHLFGSDSDDRVASLGGLLGNSQVQKLLGMLAPIVMGYIGGRVTSGSGGGGSILDSVLGGGSGGSGGGLGDLLGGILGGGSASSGATTNRSATQGENPFNTPATNDDDQPRFPTSDAQPRRAEPEQETKGGGILGSILGGIFGKK